MQKEFCVGMENDLHVRDRVGVQDFVLLEDYHNEDAFIENLRKRFKENLIYTYIGPVLVSVNPYKNLKIYNNDYVEQYQNVNFYELPPHIYAVSDTAYRSMLTENRDQCVLISGESGAGKTEASKKILHYIAAASHHSKEVERVKDRLLQSNPILEAFGNAKTTRNDNSSRFGKYMDIEFNFKGAPIGGHILNYLLEKSRVVHQGKGERNFHIFYQLLKGGDDILLRKLHLNRDHSHYFYLSQDDGNNVNSINDDDNFQTIRKALTVLEFSSKEQEDLFSIVASVLHLGNIGYTEENNKSKVNDSNSIIYVTKLLGCDEDDFKTALVNRTIETRTEKVLTPLNRDQAVYARDALAKAIYERLFVWLVQKINNSLAFKEKGRKSLMGLLDIYGFEIFQTNSFEQFCINFCNEKLQQLFIELTLKSEQDEYLSEGIEWEPVHYFNNKIICDLVEAKHQGVIAILDEECLRPGDPNDLTFLTKMEATLGTHPHFVSHGVSDSKTRKTITREQFRLLHYAGEVTYGVIGFLDKNNDLLYRDLKEAMANTSNTITSSTFQVSELNNKKRPESAATQFKQSLAQLMIILMSKEPSYIRCIKPNENKQPDRFDEKIVRHQVKYLGLMENLRVRRAGFAYRRPYEVFLKRYKSLCPATWPKNNGTVKQGVATLVRHLNYPDDAFKMGRSKLFIRFPRTLFETEDSFQHRKHELVSLIKAHYKGYRKRKIYQQMRQAVTMIATYWRRNLAMKELERRKWAVRIVRKFIKGFIYRNQPVSEENKDFLNYVRVEYLTRLTKQLPQSVLDKSWPSAPVALTETSKLLRKMNMDNLACCYCKRISSDRKLQFEQKIVAEQLFKSRKQSYPQSIGKLFVTSRLDEASENLKEVEFDKNTKPMDEKIIFCTTVTKYDRNGYKPRNWVLIVTDAALYLLEQKDFKLKHRIAFENLVGVSVSGLSDGLLILRIPKELKKDKGDLILSSDFVIETVTKIIIATQQPNLVKIEDSKCISHYMSNGKEGFIDLSTGTQPSIAKAKNGHLSVVAPVLAC